MKRFRPTRKLIYDEMKKCCYNVLSFAMATGIPLMDLNDILENDIPITEENAKKLGRALNIKWQTIHQYDKYYRMQLEVDKKMEENKDGNCSIIK